MDREKNDTYRLNWDNLKTEWPVWIVMAGLLLGAVLVYPHLPEQVPSHWNIQGEVDDYQGRFFGAFFFPLMIAGLYLLMLVLPVIDPRRENYARFRGAYTFLRWGFVIFMAILYGVTIAVALGYGMDIGLVVKAMVAGLFIIIGNYKGQFRHNYFVGIKTPWTLANEEVWQRTHRMGGKLWVICGLICLVVSPFNTTWAAAVFFGAIAVMTLVPMVYSYLLFARLQSR